MDLYSTLQVWKPAFVKTHTASSFWPTFKR